MPVRNPVPALPAPIAPVPVVVAIDGRLMTDSRNVAAMFGKHHRNVLKAVRGLLKSEQTPREFFVESSYVDPSNGQSYPYFNMSRDAFSILAMGFTGARALRWQLDYLAAFNAMEAALKAQMPAPFNADDNATLRRVLLGKLDDIDVLKAVVVEQREALAIAGPKIDAFDAFMDDRGHANLRSVARFLNAESGDFFAWLREREYVFEEGGALQPNADLRRDGYMRVVPYEYATGRFKPQTFVTAPGLRWLHTRWVARNRSIAKAAFRADEQARSLRLPGV
ncbi:Rha family transcriptional regulator [uncultured Methylobacterium sp.]|uniref:Rha family transcriptional regulator n=1 Tax=uncultured Methylobacterium sp. TaxID=157278 RepID=UPI0035C97B59